ncbi:DUF302 domain-containing protein [Marinifilum caeruleilacunae]|jgi:uncharacterized protein (DUF302 family)|uniref:DUF302 domain-containing protein n=1 Tax=Marinifilum caeruleilacunae TaxID=2499076 RepID=A0ABX1X245_9BACT|nr:DUF302 domain-containing protein [Marinifilum caeruleilacunae]NOU62164.1 DUF302 domain-containing protein [Marinifilum caeruleilacunae]
MTLYDARILEKSIDIVEERLKKLLKLSGYHIVYERNIEKKLERRANKNNKYRVIGVDPYFSYELTRIEEKVGLLLPFNILLQEINDQKVEVSIINVEFTFSTLGNARIFGVAAVIQSELDKIISSL